MPGIEGPKYKPEAGTSPENFERLFGHCYEMRELHENDQLFIGGNTFSQSLDLAILCDFDQFQPFLNKTKDVAQRAAANPDLKQKFENSKFDIDERLFWSLFAFTRNLEQEYPWTHSNDQDVGRHQKRVEALAANPEQSSLKEIFDAGGAVCSEIAALAQKYLQDDGVSSSYFSGDLLTSRDDDFSEEHSFVIIRHGTATYIYDPTIPTSKFPSVYRTEVDFDTEVRRGMKRFITGKNIVTGSEFFYGVNNGTNVVASRDIV